MNLLDDLVGGVFDNLFTGARRDRKLERLAEEGELVPATIYAIKVVSKSDTADEWYYGLDLATSAGPLRAAVRQSLIPEPWRAPLGGRVLARHLDGRVAIDWAATLAEQGVETDVGLLAGKTLKHPLEPGVQDSGVSAKRLRDGLRCEAEVLASESVTVMGMETQSRRIELRVAGESEAAGRIVSTKQHVPAYAVALSQVGSRLPIAVDRNKPDRVTIDWPGAAERAGLPAR